MGLPFHQHLFPPLKRIVWEYKMINDGDRVAVGLSGGKDSLVTVYALSKLKEMIPTRYALEAIAVDMGWPGTDWGPLAQYCHSLNLNFTLVPSNLAQLIFETRQETNPCSLCAKMRHGILHSAAKETGCNVVALGHTSDDAIETLLLNMFYAGRIHCFKPVSELNRNRLRLIRPLLYISEKTTTRVAAHLQLPVIPNPCPASQEGKRREVKEIIAKLAQSDKVISKRLLAAVKDFWGNQLTEPL